MNFIINMFMRMTKFYKDMIKCTFGNLVNGAVWCLMLIHLKYMSTGRN